MVFIIYDEQYFFIGSVLYLRLVILDAKTKMIIANDLVMGNNFNKEYVRNFLNENLKDLPLKGIIN